MVLMFVPFGICSMHCAIMSSISAANIDEKPELIDVIVEHKADIFAFGHYCPTSEDKAHMDTSHIERMRPCLHFLVLQISPKPFQRSRW